MMSAYTDRQHEKALQETLYWEMKVPETPLEAFAYGEYQFALKDYREAVPWYQKAAAKGCIPAQFQLAYCLHYQLGTAPDQATENRLFVNVLAHDHSSAASAALYRLGMCYTYGFGTAPDEKKGLQFFIQSKADILESLYELGLYYRWGKGGITPDRKTAGKYFRLAYDQYCEQAIFALYAMFAGPFSEFPFIREIQEAYSFTLGQLVRVAELNPCKEYLHRLADFYEQGYPGDTGDNLVKFKKLAQKYRRQAATVISPSASGTEQETYPLSSQP